MSGAMPPPGAEWQIGKSAASIRFVEDAMALIARLDDGKPSFEAARQLSEAIEQVKSGELSFDDWTTPEDYLAEVNR